MLLYFSTLQRNLIAAMPPYRGPLIILDFFHFPVGLIQLLPNYLQLLKRPWILMGGWQGLTCMRAWRHIGRNKMSIRMHIRSV